MLHFVTHHTNSASLKSLVPHSIFSSFIAALQFWWSYFFLSTFPIFQLSNTFQEYFKHIDVIWVTFTHNFVAVNMTRKLHNSFVFTTLTILFISISKYSLRIQTGVVMLSPHFMFLWYTFTTSSAVTYSKLNSERDRV